MPNFAGWVELLWNHAYTPGGAGQAETHGGGPPYLSRFYMNNVIHLRLRSNENQGKLPDLAGRRLNY